MDRITARRTTRCLLALTLAALAHGTAGCGDRVIDGSTTFNQQHPEYQDKPAYMDPRPPTTPPCTTAAPGERAQVLRRSRRLREPEDPDRWPSDPGLRRPSDTGFADANRVVMPAAFLRAIVVTS